MSKLDRESEEKIVKVARKTIDYLIKNQQVSRDKVTNIKYKISKQFGYDGVVKNATILEFASEEEKKIILPLLKRRSTRTISGVSIIAIMTKPLPCPGTCVYCPGEKSQPNEKVAQSYTGREPAAMRSIHNQYDAFKQVRSRIKDLEAIGHSVDKIELIIMGGTFLSTAESYQNEFIKSAYEGMLNQRVGTIDDALGLAENSQRRVIGLTIETRPDYCKEIHVNSMLSYGVTRVEIGIQTVYDEIYEIIKRGHSTKESIDAIRIAKDAGLKVNAHVMPNLPGSDLDKDRSMFETLFSDSDYRPDMLKIYPCLVLKGTELYNWWKNGSYSPYSIQELVNLLAEVKQKIPPYVRIQRIMRDIPAPLIQAGCNKSNLRQLVQERLKHINKSCGCIRCREYGFSRHKMIQFHNALDDVNFKRIDYQASKGNEIFLSIESKIDHSLLGYLRMRQPSPFAHRPELNDGKTIVVREIKVVGELVPMNIKPNTQDQIQHRGLGTILLENAEKLVLEDFDAKKLSVISGRGVRRWFYRRSYHPEGPYVSKHLA